MLYLVWHVLCEKGLLEKFGEFTKLSFRELFFVFLEAALETVAGVALLTQINFTWQILF